jgi:hypothetical protein
LEQILKEEQNHRLDRTAHPQRVHRPVRRDVERNRFAEKGISSKAVFVLLDG